MKFFRIFKTGTTREATERLKQAEEGLQSAKKAAQVSKKLVRANHAHAVENNFATIIKESIYNGYNS